MRIKSSATCLCNLCRKGIFMMILLQVASVFGESCVSRQPFKNGILLSREYDGDRPLNNAFINFLGDGSLASINYERLLPVYSDHVFITAGLGIGMNSLVTFHANGETVYTSSSFPVIPHHITGNIGSGRHFLEFGLGGTILANKSGQHYLPYLSLGYRLQPLNTNRVSARIFGSYPLQSLERFDIIYIPVGVSVGWSF